MTPTPDPAPAASESEEPKQPDLSELQKEIESLRGQVNEHQRASQFWYEKANAAKGEPKEQPKAAEPEEDILDLITTKGAKGLHEYLRKQGFTSKDEVDAAVNNKARELLSEQELMRQYPDLAPEKRDSEFFKATALEYGRLCKEGVPERVAMAQAAANTELAFLKSGKLKTPEAERKSRREADRQARIDAQGGDRNLRSQGFTAGEEEDDTITPEEERIIKGMLVGQPGADNKPMNLAQATEAYKKRAKSGSIQVSTRSRR